MSNRTNIINNFILLGGGMLGILAVGIVSSNISVGFSFKVFYGVLLFVIINTMAHEFAHIIAGKLNGFKTISFKLLCFKFHKIEGKFKVSIIPVGEQVGEAELIPTEYNNIEKRYKKVAMAGIIANVIILLLSIPFFFFWKKWFWGESAVLYYLTAFSMPISLYFVLANALPMSNNLVRNDAAILWGIAHDDPATKVMFSLLKVHALLYKGYTPAEIPEEYYFDVPQLPEDEPNFIMLLNNRYYYYLDKGDYENATKVINRLESVQDYIEKYMEGPIGADMLYSYCTFMKNDQTADNLMEDYDKYLNKVINSQNMRAKLAYVLYVLQDEALVEDMFNKTLELAEKTEVLGLKKLEIKLVKDMENDVKNLVNNAK